MKKFFLRVVLTLILTHWGYAELSIIAPQAKSHLDTVISKVSIPTHDKWHEHYMSFEEKRLAFIDLWNANLGVSKDSKSNIGLLTRLNLE